MPDQPAARYFDKGRVEAYTDAVFAIAATLLVLDLTTTAIGQVGSDGQLWADLAGMWPSFSGFGVSFALLSLLWMIHLQQFRDIARADATLIWLNNARLLFVVLIPFTTSLVSDYSDYYAGRMLLPINFFFAALLGHLSWRWAAARDGHLLTEESTSQIIYQGAGGLAAVICGFVAMAVSPWAGSWGFLAYAFNGLLTGAIQRRRLRRMGPTAS
ncbi:TMEM175 family protein [Microbacterium sp. CJ88]|uniref:TMEM175 family protein n=1 Tax=Microbacterium sp. CJ88 TaxID=3445672 RepID=UPI003F65AF3E